MGVFVAWKRKEVGGLLHVRPVKRLCKIVEIKWMRLSIAVLKRPRFWYCLC